MVFSSIWAFPRTFSFVLLIAFGFSGMVRADEGKFRSVRIGFTQAPGFGAVFSDPRLAKGLTKPGMTHPVFVELATGHGAKTLEIFQSENSGRLIKKAQTISSDLVSLSFPLSTVPNAPVTLRLLDGESRVLAEEVVIPNSLPAGKPVVLCIGPVPGGAKRLWGTRDSSALPSDSTKAKNPDEDTVAVTFLEKGSDFPADAASYESTDLILVNPDQGGASFASQSPNSQALVTAIRNGSRMAIGASSRSGEVQAFVEALQVAKKNQSVEKWLDATPGALINLPEPRRLDRLYRWLDSRKPFEALQVQRIQQWIPGRSALPLAQEPLVAGVGTAVELPAIWPLWEIPSGRGAVLTCGFSLDSAPLALWRGEDSFFRRLLAWSGAVRSGGTSEDLGAGASQAVSFEQDLARILGTFPGVVLFSFGWVLMAILGYLILIGPVEWWLVDRVWKRPGLTWAMLPLVVVVSCALIPLLVARTKGAGLRLNQIHIVEYDLADPKPVASGVSWISIFSPKGISVNPSALVDGKWSGQSSKTTARLLPWSGPRAGTALFSAQQEFISLKDDSLEGLELRVNTDQAFRADWSTPIGSGNPPLETKLLHPLNNPAQLVGTVTNRLGVAIDSPVFVYRGRFHPLERSILPGETVDLDELRLGGGGRGQELWSQASMLAPERSGAAAQLLPGNGPDSDRHQLIKQLFMGEARHPGLPGTWNLRWRIFAPYEEAIATGGNQNAPIWRPRDEVILLGRTALDVDQTQDTKTISANANQKGPLFMNLSASSPGHDTTTLQETYIRAILPVAGPFSPPVKTVKP